MASSTDCSHEAHEHQLVPRRTLERAAAIGAALGDVERVHLLELLLAGRHCVSELAEETQAAMPTVSQRLRLLTQAHLVHRTREGRHVFYSLADDHVRQLLRELLTHADE